MKISPLRISLMALSIALIALTAQIKFNVGPIPYTFQNLGVTFASLILPPINAFMTIILYLLLICCGFPLAAGGSGGPAVLFGYTAGYLWGFAISAPLMSFLSKVYLKRKNIRLSDIKGIEIVVLLIISTISFLPTYFFGLSCLLKIRCSRNKHL